MLLTAPLKYARIETGVWERGEVKQAAENQVADGNADGSGILSQPLTDAGIVKSSPSI
jgi:hypothetical protein